ncbi:MAG: DMT family transporter [Pseudomonadota bacterium]
MSKGSSNFYLAVAVVLSAIALFDIMSAIIKYLTAFYSVQQLSVFRNIFGIPPTILILLWTKDWIDSGRPIIIRQWKHALLRGFIVAGAQVFLYLGLINLDFAVATTIAFSGPLFITALSIPILGHRIGPWRWAAVAIGFLGVLLVVRPNAADFTFYAFMPACAALCYASVSVSSRLFDESIPTALINMYSIVGALAGSVGLLVFTGNVETVASLEHWLLLIAMGAAGGTAVFCLVYAYRLAEPSSLSPFEYFGIPFSFVLGWLIFNEAPFGRLIPGVFLIVGGGLMIVWREHMHKKQ